MPDIATAYVQIVPTTKGIGNDLKNLLDGPSDAAGASAGSKAGSSFASGLGKGLKTAGLATAAIGAAVAGASGAVVAGAKDVATYGDNIDKMSQKLGLSSDAYQKWDYVLNLAGTDMQSMTTGLKTLTNKFDDAKKGNEGAIAMFEQLGISMEQAANMSREDLFAAAINGFQQMEDSTERAALANDLFGRSGQNLAPLFNTTAEATAEMIQKAEDYGMVMSEDNVKASAAFVDSMTTLQNTITGLKNDIMSEFLPSMTQVTDGLALIFSGDTAAGIASVKSGIDGFLSSFSEILPQILTIGGEIIMQIAQGILNSLPQLAAEAPAIINTLITFITSNLPQIVSFAAQIIVSLVVGIIQALPQLIAAIPQIINAIVTTLSQNGPQLQAAGLSLLEMIKSGILSALSSLADIGMNIVRGIWSGISGGFDWIKNMISGWVGNVLAFIKQLFGIASPSKVMAEQVGKWIPAGMAEGILDNADIVDDAMDTLKAGTLDALTLSPNITPGSSEQLQRVGNIQIIINGAAHQDERAIAKYVEQVLIRNLRKESAVYA